MDMIVEINEFSVCETILHVAHVFVSESDGFLISVQHSICFNVSWKNRKFLPFVLTSAVVHVVIIQLTCELLIIFVAYMKLRIIWSYQLDKTNINVDFNEDSKESAFCSDSNFSLCNLRTLNIPYVLETGLCSVVYMP